MILRNLAGIAIAALVMATMAPRASAFPSGVCPSIGEDAGCDTGMTLNADGTVTIQNGLDRGPYDGEEDTLVGVVNNSGRTITQIGLSGTNIFGFDGDGICTFTSCGYANPTGYEGPGTSFAITDANSGLLLLGAGLANGASAYFSLENSLAGANFQAASINGNPLPGNPLPQSPGPQNPTPGTTGPETPALPTPTTLFLLGLGLAALMRLRQTTTSA